jgi:vacuolar protein sorting-associated protein 13A/C
VLTIEAGVKDFTRPMILLENTLQGNIQNWSTQLMAKAETRLQISYYNETLNIWEPLIEPVLHEHTGWESWKLQLEVKKLDYY